MKKIKEYDNYFASRKGEIYSDKNGELFKLKPYLINTGYAIVSIRNDEGQITKTVHRIIAETFIPNPNNKKQVNHINCDKEDNRVENLEWVTCSENHKHAFNNGIKTQAGINNSRCRLTENEVLEIRNAYRLGCFTQTEIAEAYNVSSVNISAIITRRSWKHI